MKKLFITAVWLIFEAFVFVGGVEALLMADDYVIGKTKSTPVSRTSTQYSPIKPKKDKISASDPEDREKYYREVKTESGITLYAPNQELINLCLTAGGCSLDTITAKYQPEGEKEFRPYIVKGPYDPLTGQSGTGGNQYLENSAQHGISGFYQAPNGGWYPIVVPPPPRNPGEPFARRPEGEQEAPIPTQIIWIVTLTPTPTPYLGPWPKLKNSSYASRFRVQSTIPGSPIAYDSDDTTQPYFIIGDGGVVNSVSPLSLCRQRRERVHPGKFLRPLEILFL
jgi:hypothetical protein